MSAARAQPLLACGWAAVLCAVLLAQTWVRAQRPGGIDLTSYLLSAQALLHGESPYLLPTPFPYLYPSTLAFLLIPLAFVPPAMAVIVWFASSVAAAVWSIRAVVLVARPDLAARRDEVVLFLAVFFTFFYTITQSNLRNGQVNLIVLALCVAAVALPGARLKPRAPLEPRAPLAWSLAVAIKLFPLALVPFFGLRRSWLWLVASVALIAAWCLLPAVVLGGTVIDIYEQYVQVLRASSAAPLVQPLDFSLAGTIAWATRTSLTPMLRVSAAAVVFGWIFQADARRLRSETARPSALYLLAIPLVSPHSEVHHLAFMLPASALVGSEVWWERRHGSRSLQVSAAIAAALYLAATAIPIARGQLFCAALIAFGVALMNATPQGRLKPATTETVAHGELVEP